MKKAVLAACALLIIVCAVLLIGPWAKPALDAAEPVLAVHSDGRVFLAENRAGRSYLYSVDAVGRVDSVYSEPTRAEDARSAVTALTVRGDSLYFVRELTAARGAADWELARVDLDSGRAETLASGRTDTTGAVAGLSSDGTNVFLTFIGRGAAPSWAVPDDSGTADMGYYGEMLAELGVISGYADGSYDPGSSLSWGELLKMVVTSASLEVRETAPDTSWAQKYLNAAIRAGILSPDELPDGDTPLEESVTKYELALLLCRTLEKAMDEAAVDTANVANHISGYNTIPVQYSYAVAQCYAKGIMEFAGSRLYGENETVSRGDAIEAMIRLNYPETRMDTDYTSYSEPTYVSGVTASAYLVRESGDGAELSLMLETVSPVNTEIVDAVYGDALYCLLGNGTVVRAGLGGISPVGSGQADYVTLSCDGGYVCAYDRSTGGILVSTQSFTADPAYLGAKLSVRAAAASAAGETVLLGVTESGGTALLRFDGETISTTHRLGLGFGDTLTFKLPLLLTALLALALLAVLVLLFLRVQRYGRHLQGKLVVTAGAACLAGLAVIYVAVLSLTAGSFRSERLSEAEAWGIQRLSQAEETDLAMLGEADFYASENYVNLRRGLTPASYEAGQGAIETESALLTLGGLPTVAVSRDLRHGLTAEEAFGPALADMVSEAAETGEIVKGTVTVRGAETGVCAMPISVYGQTRGILVTTVSMEDIAARLGTLRLTLGLISLGALAAAFVIIFLLTRRAIRPMFLLTKRMGQLSDGIYQLEDIETGSDEIGEMWRTMREMGVSLAIKDYETQSLIHSFYRFVPRGLDKLLDRSNIMEVSFGDSATIIDNIGIMTVNNRDAVRAMCSDKQFMGFVNRCFAAINSNVLRYRGVLLSSDFDLGGVKALYPESADDGLRCALSLLGEAADRDGEAEPELFVMLHRATFLYGVAGSEDKAFPFLASSELSFMTSFAGRFLSTGARIVMTEQYLRCLRDAPSARYIGFISSPDGQMTYKLYESLDAYPDLEKRLRLQNDAKLQEAIQLFYRNDFYLARNAFSNILKACPSDGIARWYLFASEHFFNSDGADLADYSLFSIEE